MLLWTAILPVSAADREPGKLGVYRFPEELARELGRQISGAEVYLVIPGSPAAASGLRPGDVITAINGQPIRDFSHLAGTIAKYTSGKTIELTYRRGSETRRANVTLAAQIGDATESSHRACLQFLRSLLAVRDGPVLAREIVATRWELGERRQAADELARALAKHPQASFLKLYHLELLRKVGQFDRYVKETMTLAELYPASPAFQLEKVEALLATGRLAEAEDAAIEVLQASTGRAGLPSKEVIEGLRRWVLARLRQGKSLQSPATERFGPGVWRSPALAVLNYWRHALAGRSPYQLADRGSATELDLESAGVLLGLVRHRMHGIKIQINGVLVPLAIVDTGASHTLLNVKTATAAGIAIGAVEQSAAGSLSFTARPGYVRELKIGDLVLQDLPVNVGNPPPLLFTKADVALGIDLMSHLRFTIDYPRKKVRLAPTGRAPAEAPSNPSAVWDIPLWTFSDHCMTSGAVPNGGSARVLIDSGNFAHTLVWPTWAKQNIKNHPGPVGSLVAYAFTNPRHKLGGLSIGGRTLPDWPVVDMPPVTLKDLDLLDVLMGHDLLSQYQVTVDLPNRRLRLASPAGKLSDPVPPKPGLF